MIHPAEMGETLQERSMLRRICQVGVEEEVVRRLPLEMRREIFRQQDCEGHIA